MKYYMGAVPDEESGPALAEIAAIEIIRLGGRIQVAADGSILLVQLPEDANKSPQELVGGGVVFHEVHVNRVPVVEDHHIAMDETEN